MADTTREFEVDFREYLSLVWRRKWLIISLFVVAIISAYFLVNTLTPIYQTSATILIQSDDGMQSIFTGEMFSMGKNLANTYSRILKTRSYLEQVIQRLDLTRSDGSPMRFNELRSLITVNTISGTDLIEISIQHANPLIAMDIVNVLVEVFQEKNREMNKSTLTGAREFVERQLLDVKGTLDKAENELLAYKQTNNIILPSEEARQALERLVEIDSFRAKTLVEQKAIDASLRGLEETLAGQDEVVVSSTTIAKNPLIKQYKTQIADLEGKLVGLKAKFTPNHPDVIEIESNLAMLTESLSNEVEEEVSAQTKTLNPIHQSLYEQVTQLQTNWLANEAKLIGYEQLITEYENNLKHLPEKELDLVRLERVAKVTGEIYTMLMTRLEEFKISESMQTSNVYVVEYAFLPTAPIKPNKKMLIMIAGVLALMAGLGLTLLIEYMDTTVKSTEEVEKMLGLPVLGSIPDMRKFKNRGPKQ